MNKTSITARLLALGLLVSACGSETSTGSPTTTDPTAAPTTAATQTPVTEPSTTTTAGEDPEDLPADGTRITTAGTDLGEILVDGEGRTVYGFTSDFAGRPTCEGGCEATWPAVTVEGDELPAGLDPAVFSLVDGVDGSKQLKAGEWPLYYYAADATPGDINGQSVGDAWYVVSPAGELIT